MLVLLIMLIVTIPPQRHAVKLDTPLPPPPNQPPPEEPDRADPDHRRLRRHDLLERHGGEPLGDGAGHDAHEAVLDLQPEIHIEPHKLAKYAVVAEVMASAQRLGLEKLGVIGGTQ